MQFNNAISQPPRAIRNSIQPPPTRLFPKPISNRSDIQFQSVDQLIHDAKEATWFISVTPTARYARPEAEVIIENMTELNRRKNLSPADTQKTREGYHTIKKELEKAIRHHLGLSFQEPLFLEPLNRIPKVALLAKTLHQIRRLESEFNQQHLHQANPGVLNPFVPVNIQISPFNEH